MKFEEDEALIMWRKLKELLELFTEKADEQDRWVKMGMPPLFNWKELRDDIAQTIAKIEGGE